MPENAFPAVLPGDRDPVAIGLRVVVAMLALFSLGTLLYLSAEEDSGWDGVFMWTSIAFGWGFTVVALNNQRRETPNALALWFAFGLYALFGFGGVFGMTAYWLVAEDQIYPLTVLTLVGVVVTTAAMAYTVVSMTRKTDAGTTTATEPQR